MAAQPDDTRFPPFAVTRAAIEQIESLGGAVRIDVVDGGCCGQTYDFSTADGGGPAGDDTAYGCPGAWLVVGARAAAVLDGATLDYAERLKPPRFRVIANPSTEHVCACRRSFGRVWPGPGQRACRAYQPMPWDTTFEPPRSWQRQTGYDEGAAGGAASDDGG